MQNTTICNIYAPSGSAQRAARENFFNETLPYYLRHRTTHVILAGDFNCVLRTRDSSSPNTSPALKAAVQQLQLHDVWEKLCPRDAGYTYVCRNAQSRLDRIYVSSNLREHLRTTHAHVCSFTDHKALTLRLCLPHLGQEHGRGFWSLRPYLLTDENIEEFQYKWQYWTRQRRNYSSWIEWWISFVKPRIKSFFKWKSRAVFDEFHNEHQRLYRELRLAYDGYYQHPEMVTTINRLKGEMLAHQRRFSHTFMRINETHVAGEPISVFQLGERRRKKTTITQLQTEQDVAISEPRAIEAHMVDYFTALYSEQGGEENENNFPCETVIPPNDPLNEACTSDISTLEIWSAIKESASRKSPGCDGIPREFYHRMFDVIHRELNLLMNEALSGNLPPAFVEGIVVLVKKRGGDHTARSYRPISLLNSDYKLFSPILKTRLEQMVREHHVLSDGQKCANSERNIFQATLALKDRIAKLRHHRRAGKLISFDLDHAFDRVRHSFLFETMRSLGFNRDLIALLALIASRSTSRLLINGHLSAPFEIQRSVRQGDPLSMLLFVLYLQPLVCRLERVCGTDLLVAYADDISVIVTSTTQIEAMMRLFARFETAAGAKLNLRKTVAIDVGFYEGNTINTHWLQTTNEVKILGVIFTNSIRQMTTLNWNVLVGKFTQQMWLQSLRTLTLHQKIVMLNTFGTSRIWYLASVLPPGSVHTAKITSIMGTFLWRGTVARVPMMQLARSRERGGLKLQLPLLKCKSLAINRHLQEIESLPFYRSLLFHADPRPAISIDLPDLRLILSNLSQIPHQIQQNPSADQIHQHYLNQTELPRVERNDPANDWPRTWRNIASRQFTSVQRSNLFLLVNEKVEHRKLLYVMRRVDDENCTHCHNHTTETLIHKFSTCIRVEPAWASLQQRINRILGGWRRLGFEDLIKPVLPRINKRRREDILKLFINYICFVNSRYGTIDIGDLNFHLEVGC